MLEVQDIFHTYGESFRREHKLSLEQHKVMSAIEKCRTAALVVIPISVVNADTRESPTIPVATAIAQNARRWPRSAGSTARKTTFWMSATFMWYSLCPMS